MKLADMSVLQPAVLTGLIQEFNGPAETKLVPLFDKNKIPSEAGEAKWDVEVYGRGITTHTTQEGQAQEVAKIGVKQITTSPARIFKKKTIPASRLNFIRSTGEVDPMDQSRINAYIRKELQDLKNLIVRTMEHTCASALSGAIAISNVDDKVNQVIASVSFPIQSIVSSLTWGSATTEILTANTRTGLPYLRRAMMASSGMAIGQVLATDAYSRALMNNSQVQILYSDRRKDQIWDNHQITQIDGLNISYMDHGYVSGSTFYEYLNPSQAIYLPENESDVIGMVYSPEFVPVNPGFKASETPGNAMKAVQGIFAYSEIIYNPVSIVLYAGVNYLPVFTRPKACIKHRWNV